MHSSAAPAPDGLACARRLRSVSTTCPALLPPLPTTQLAIPCTLLQCGCKARQEEANPPLAKPDLPGLPTISRSLYYSCFNQIWLVDKYTLLHFAIWTNYTFCKGRSTCPPLSAPCAALYIAPASTNLGVAPLLPWNLGFLAKLPTFMHLLAPPILLFQSQLPLLVRPSQFSGVSPSQVRPICGRAPTNQLTVTASGN